MDFPERWRSAWKRCRPGLWTVSLVLLGAGTAPAVLGAPPDSALYNRRICLESTASSAVQATASGLDSELQDMTGVEFSTTTTTNGPGIYLLRAAADLAARYPALSAHQSDLTNLATKGSEGFWLWSPGTNALFIVGNSDDALGMGTYYYLQQLGWRALLPGSNWTIRPLLGSITLSIDSVKEPAFRQRDFFGTGGFGGSLPLDPTRQVEADWTRWKSVNLFGGSIAIGGHEGEDFNTRNATAMQTNDALRAYNVYPTSHYAYDLIVKPDAHNPVLQALYVADRVAAYNPANYAVSVEPADGDGFCVCPWDTEYDPVCSQVFGLAKRVADALNAAHPGAMVSLYAYNSHAAVPADPALKTWLADPAANVYVDVIPYAFQRTGLDGDALAAAWAAAKPNNRGIYDYWSIPDWSNNLPDQNLSDSVRKLQYWASLGYDGLASESTFSAGSVGLLWYMAGQLMFDASLDPTALRQEFYQTAFGPAAVPMQRMIERWGRDFTLTEQELGNSFLDVAEARTLAANDSGSLVRVNDYARYVQYIRLWFEYSSATGGSTNRHAAADALLKFAWQIHRSDMVHTYRMNELIRQRYESTDTVLQADWNPGNASAAGWAWVKAHPLTDADIPSLVAAGVAAYATAPNHVPFDQPTYSTNLVALNPNYTLDGQLTAVAQPLYGGGFFTFYVKPGIASLTFQFTPGGFGGVTDIDSLWVYNPAGAIVYSNSFGGNGVYGSNSVPVTFTVNTATSGNYRIYVYDPKKGFSLAAERNLPFVLTTPLTSSYQINQKAWFYVPPGTTTVGLYAPGALPVVVLDGNGTNVSRSFGSGIGESDYLVPAGQAGKVWSMGNLKCYAPGAWPLNAPRVWSFSPTGDQHGMMVPANAAPAVSAGLDAAIVSPTNSASLNGTVTDDRLTASPYWSSAWTKISGPGTVTFGNSAAVDTTATFSAPGTYVLRLTATDTGGLSAYDEVSITYGTTAPNTAPSVNAGNDLTLTLPNNTIALDGTVTDDGLPAPAALSYSWTQVDGPGSVIFADAGAVDTSATFDTPGTYRLRLTASDGQLAAYDETTVTVIPDYNAPTYQVGDLGTFGTPTGFNCSSVGQTFNSTNSQYSARFRALETMTVDRVYQRLIGVDSNTTVQIGIMADDGAGNPAGTFLAATVTNHHPATGDSIAWAVFTNSVTLQSLQVYHVVTRATALGSNESFMVYCSGGNQPIRPYDRATDAFMNGMGSSDGGQTWWAVGGDPYLTLGNGSNVVAAGPGNAEQASGANLWIQGGTGRAAGQKFTISTREAPATAALLFTNLTLQVQKQNATHDLVIRLRRGDGTVMASISKTAADLATTLTTYTWNFDGGALVRLVPGHPYFLTTELAGTGTGTTEYYYFNSIYTDGNTGANSWGGTNICVPVQSGTGGSWSNYPWSAPTLFGGREQFDLWFQLAGPVQDINHDSVGDGVSDYWRQWYFGGDGTTTNDLSCALCDPDGDGSTNLDEYRGGTDPRDPLSRPARLVINPAILNCGQARPGTAVQAVFQVINAGSTVLNGTGSVASGAFAIAAGTPFSVSGWSTGLVTVSFSPAATGSVTDNVVFASNGGASTNRVTGTGQLPGPIIVDNTDVTGVAIVGPWLVVNGTPGFYGPNCLNDGNLNKGSMNVRFTPNLPAAGAWQVYLRWAAAANRASNVPVDIVSSNGSVRVTVNEQVNGGQWNLLGTFSFVMGTNGSVTVRNEGTSGYVIADAVEFVYGGTAPAPPAAPTSLTATAVSSSAINLAWTDNATNEDGYVVERSGDGVSYQTVATLGSNVTGYADSGLTASTLYYYRVRACSTAGGNSGYSNVAHATTGAVTTLIVDNADATGVVIVGSWLVVNGTPGFYGPNCLNDGNLNKGSMSVRFTPVLPVGGQWQVYLRWAAAANRASNVPVDIVSSNGSVRVTVNEQVNGGQWNLLGTFSLVAGTNGNVTVRNDGTDGYVIADAVEFVYSAAPPAPPAAPTNLTATAVSSSAINLAWADNATNEETYVVERSGDGVSYQSVTTLGSNVTGYADSGLAAATVYYYRARAYNTAGGYSGYSNVAHATTTGGATTLIVDNADASGVAIVGPWLVVNGTPGFYGPNCLNDGNLNKGSMSVRFTPVLPVGGQWQVYLRWAAAANRASNVPVDIVSSNGSVRVTVNEQVNGGQWNLLGTFSFVMGTNGSVTVRNEGTSGYVIADAVEFVYGGTAPAPPAAPTNLTATAVSSSTINLAWADNATNEDGHVVERSGDGVSYQSVTTLGSNVTAYGDSGLAAATVYYYRVRAYNTAGGYSGYSNVAQATTPAGSAEIIVDNADASGVVIVGPWLVVNGTPGFYGPNCLNDGNLNKGSMSVRFTPVLPVGGQWQVYLRWAAAANRASNVPVDIVSSNGSVRVTVNEQVNGGQWNLLGTYSFVAGTNGSVTVRNDGTDGYVIADAVRFVPSGSGLAAGGTASTVAAIGAIADVALSGVSIGTGSSGSSRILADGSWEITGTGSGFGVTDSLYFEQQTYSGDFTVMARIESLTSDGAFPQAGLMIREGLAADARLVSVAATWTNQYWAARQVLAGTALEESALGSTYVYPDAWVALARQGDTVTIYTSADGEVWVEEQTVTVPALATSVNVGLFLSSGTPGVEAQTIIQDFSVIAPGANSR